MAKQLKVELVKLASRANIGHVPRARFIPNKKRKLLEKARMYDERRLPKNRW
jgi:hypothetical protein